MVSKNIVSNSFYINFFVYFLYFQDYSIWTKGQDYEGHLRTIETLPAVSRAKNSAVSKIFIYKYFYSKPVPNIIVSFFFVLFRFFLSSTQNIIQGFTIQISSLNYQFFFIMILCFLFFRFRCVGIQGCGIFPEENCCDIYLW